MTDINTTPVRKVTLSGFSGDTWAQPAAQVAIPDTIPRLRCTSTPVRFRLVAYDGVSNTANPVTADTTTVNMVMVKLRVDADNNTTLTQTATLVESTGSQVRVGKQITEDDVSPSEVFCLGFVGVTAGAAAAVWVFVDAGAEFV